jgi:putative addiction module component (TIGR02574 family)
MLQEQAMTDRVSELAAQGRSLPPEERVRLLDLLLESLHDPSSAEVEQAWNAEIERRVAAHERGEGRLYDVEYVMAEAARIAP